MFKICKATNIEFDKNAIVVALLLHYRKLVEYTQCSNIKTCKVQTFICVLLEEPKSQVLPGFVRYVSNPEMCIFKNFGVFAILQSCAEYVQSCSHCSTYCSTFYIDKVTEIRAVTFNF